MNAIADFLDMSCARKIKVDLRTRSGYSFVGVLPTRVQDGAVELRHTANRVIRLYVLALDQIEWAVRSRER